MAQADQTESPAAACGADPRLSLRRRRRAVIILGLVTVILTGMLTFQSSFNILPYLSPDDPGDILWLYTLSAINFITFVVFLMVLGRNVLKLLRERARRQVGARFKTRLVLFSIAISLLPMIFLFLFSYGLINRSVDKWFSLPANRALDDAERVQDHYIARELGLLSAATRELAAAVPAAGEDYARPDWLQSLASRAGEPAPVYLEAVRGERQQQLAKAGPAPLGAELSAALEIARQNIRQGLPHQQVVPGDNRRLFLLAADGQARSGIILVRELPRELAAWFAEISENRRQRNLISSQGRRVKLNNLLILGSITLMLLFAAMWFALHMARGITEPIVELVTATAQVARGNLDYRVGVRAEGELALLVASFNQMAGELAASHAQIKEATAELRQTNSMLDERRRYIETILQSLSTGVISLDDAERLTTINDSALVLLQLPERPAAGAPLAEFLRPPNYQGIAKLMRRARRVGAAARELELERPDGSAIPTATSAIPLKGGAGQYQGMVIMIEDLTEFIKAQRAAAWSEVAQRMAHEIKNPLTPIQLSAERIARRLSRTGGAPGLRQIEPVVKEGTATIIREVDTLKRMVDEFSRFARLPKAKPEPASLNEVVRNALALYTDRTNGIVISDQLDLELPLLNLDANQYRQVLVNLIDNALEAIGDHGVKGEINIETRYLKAEGKACLSVTDTGHGVAPADRDKLFQPHFSTRGRGTGLGLAIVNHIVTEHGGRIFVEGNQPRGTRFVIELPV